MALNVDCKSGELVIDPYKFKDCFGRKQNEMIHYYTEFKGMHDTITPEDLVDSEEKSHMQNKLDESNTQRQLMEDCMKAMEKQLQTMQEMMVNHVH